MDSLDAVVATTANANQDTLFFHDKHVCGIEQMYWHSYHKNEQSSEDNTDAVLYNQPVVDHSLRMWRCRTTSCGS